MPTYIAGRESSILTAIIKGEKTIECRLAKGKYLTYQAGDQVHLREDIWQDGHIIASHPPTVIVEVLKVTSYRSFKEMFSTIGFEHAIPNATTVNEAIAVCRQFYTVEQELHFGVLAIYFKLIQAV